MLHYTMECNMKYVHAYMYIHGTTKSFMIRDHADHSQVAELVLHCRNSYDHCTSILIVQL